MRAAPPVQALSRATGAWRLVHCVLYATAAGSLVFWAACWWAGPGALSVLAGSAAAAGAWALFMRFDRPVAQRLRWDGSTWCAEVPRGEWVQGQPVLVIDLGSWLLVRFLLDSAPRPTTTSSAPRGGMSKVAEPHLLMSHRPWPQSRWLPLSRTDNRTGWHDLRVALHAGVALPDATPMSPVLPPAG